ncbi:MAG: nicotinate-nucleotide adenylyltransferase [Clostridia bacterium]|nr:nicotinate-nucleotide adenylyltransferase [Clostridia bacterium]
MKIGILGGTFDPVHNGHLDMARFCQEAFALDRVMFLPLGDAPHKTHITSKRLRAAMLRAALVDQPNFVFCDMELKRRGKTYTVETLKTLTEQAPDTYYYIIGGDTVGALLTWKDPEEVFRMTEFIVVDRHGYDSQADAAQAISMGARLHFTHHEGLDISSSQVRTRVKEGLDIDTLVPLKTAEVIRKYGIYRN